jgi:hypothetical protein
MLHFIIKKLEFLYYKKIFYLFLFYIFLLCVLSVIFGNELFLQEGYLFDENKNIILNNIPFYYGPLIENIINGKGYFHSSYGIDVYLDRFPFLPFTVVLISKISTNIFIFLSIKNIIFFSIFFFCLNIYCKEKNIGYIYFFLILLVPLYNFYNITTLLNFFFSDSYIGILLPCIFLILISENKNKYIIVSFILFCLFFTKTTMFFVTISIPFLFLIFEKKTHILKRLSPLIFIISAWLIWGTFGLIKTDVFTIGFKTTSSSQLALKSTLNNDFHKYYPKKSVDLIPGKHDANKKNNNQWNDEWDMYDYYKNENTKYFKENKIRILKDTFIKVKFILFNIHKDAVHPDKNGNFNNLFMFSHLINRIVLIISLIVCLNSIFKNLLIFKFQKLDFYYFIILISSVIPLLIGWATSKHLVGIFILSHLYLIQWTLNKKNLKKYLSVIS